jgi:hypothetical protein
MYYQTARALQSLTLEEVNQAAADLCSHITGFNEKCKGADGVTIAVACMPKGIPESDPAYCDADSLVKTIYEACQIEVEPEEDIHVPHTLIPEDEA